MEIFALAYRNKTGCRQYPFETKEELLAWCTRWPYRDEVVNIMLFGADKRLKREFLAKGSMVEACLDDRS